MFPLRDENPSHAFPFFVIVLIALNAILFFYELSLGPLANAFIQNYGLLPWEISNRENMPESAWIPPYWSLITSMFLHGGIGHFLGNAWFLWIFGDNIEDSMGHFRFVIFYFVCGIAAGLTQVYLDPASTIPTIGASGAISGVLGGYIVLFPRIRIKTLITIGFYFNVVRIPAVYYLGIWFLMQALGILGPNSGVAFGAHAGGFIMGALYTLLLTRPRHEPIPRFETRRLPRW